MMSNGQRRARKDLGPARFRPRDALCARRRLGVLWFGGTSSNSKEHNILLDKIDGDSQSGGGRYCFVMGSIDNEVLKSDEEETGVVEQERLTQTPPLPCYNRHGRRSLSRPRRKLNCSDLGESRCDEANKMQKEVGIFC